MDGDPVVGGSETGIFANDVTLRGNFVGTFGNFGIRGQGVNNFTLADSDFSNNNAPAVLTPGGALFVYTHVRKNAPIAMILHPHPQFHGTMNHQIVYQCYYAFAHRGFSVLATSPEYFTRFRYGNRQSLQLREGKPFSALFDAVVESRRNRRDA